VPKGWTLESDLRLRIIAPRSGPNPLAIIIVQIQYYPQTKEALAIFTNIYLG
jgi:hypothetical protein